MRCPACGPPCPPAPRRNPDSALGGQKDTIKHYFLPKTPFPAAVSPQNTIGNGLHGDAGGVFAVAFLVELHHGPPAVALRGVQRVEAARVGAQLLHRARPERVAGGDEDAETVLDQPERDLGAVNRLLKNGDGTFLAFFK